MREGSEQLTKDLRVDNYHLFPILCDPLQANIFSRILREDLICPTSRMGDLLALRRRGQIDMLLDRDFPFEVELLSYSEWENLISKVALDHAVLLTQGIENADKDVVQNLENMGGIPLVLELLGFNLKKKDCSII